MIVKGYELLKMVNDGEITEGTIVKIKEPKMLSDIEYIFDGSTFWKYKKNNRTSEEMRASTSIGVIFEIPEKENGKIEEYKTKYTESCIEKEIVDKLNEVIRAVNKLNEEREISEKETNCMTD